MNARVETLFGEMFLSCAYSFESMRELSLRTGWLMSQGSLKQLVPLFENAAAFGNSTETKPVLQKSFMFCLDLF